METIEINFNNNPEDYTAFIRAIRNLEILFERPFFDDIQFYDPEPESDLGYESCEEESSSSCTTQAASDLESDPDEGIGV